MVDNPQENVADLPEIVVTPQQDATPQDTVEEDISFDLGGDGDTEFSFGIPDILGGDMPVAPFKRRSPVAEFVVESDESVNVLQGEDSVDPGVEYTKSKKFKKQVEGDAATRDLFNQDITPSIEDIQNTQRIYKEAADNLTIGKAYQEQHFPSAEGDDVARAIDYHTYREDDERASVALFGEDPDVVDYTELLEQRTPETKEIASKLASVVPSVTVTPEDTTWKDIAEILGAVPIDDSVEIEFWEFTKGLFRGEFSDSADELTRQLEARYGENWELKFAAFAAKEIAVDAALLIASGPIVASLGLARKGLPLASRIKATLIKAGVIGAGGGGVQASLNQAAGADSQFQEEFAIRALGFAGGEAVIAAGRGGYRAWLNRTARETIESQGQTVVRNVDDLLGDEVPGLYEALAKASSDTGSTQEQRRLAAKVAKLLRDGGNIGDAQRLVGVNLNDFVVMDNQLGKNILDGNAIGFRIMSEVHKRQRKVQDVFATKIDRFGNFKFSDEPFKVKEGKELAAPLKVAKLLGLGEPEDVVGPIMRDLADVQRFTAKMKDNLTSLVKDITKGLGSKQIKQVENALQHGADIEKIYSPTELTAFFNMDADAIDAYYALRAFYDHSAMLLDQTVVRHLNNKGLKMYQGKVVKVLRTQGDDLPAGQVEVQFIDSVTGSKGAEIRIPEASIEDITTAIGTPVGYIPRIYKDANFHVSMQNTTTGEIRRIDGFKTRQQAISFIQSKQKNLDKDQVLFYDKWDAEKQVLDFGTTRETADKLAELSDSELDSLIENLTSLGLDPKILTGQLKAIDGYAGGGVLKGHAARRGKTGLLSAELEMPIEATRQYIASISRQAGVGDWREYATASFMKTYGNRLGMKTWDDVIPKQLAKQDNIDYAKVKRAQQHLQRAIRGYTTTEEAVNNAVEGSFRKLGKVNNPALRHILGWFENYQGLRLAPFLRKPVENIRTTSNVTGAVTRGMKGVAATTQVLTAPVQILVQSALPTTATFARVLSKNGLRVDKTIADVDGVVSDLMGGVEAIASKKLGYKMPEATKTYVTDLERSGFVADLTTTDIGQTLTSAGNLGKVLTAFFRGGEGINRVTAFTAARRWALREIKDGTFTGLNNKPLAKQQALNSDGTLTQDALRKVVKMAEETSLAMHKAAELESTSGLLALSLQYVQFYPKMLRSYVNKDIPGKERLGMLAATAAVFGWDGIPLAPDAVEFADQAVYAISANGPEPSKRKIVSNFVADLGAKAFLDVTPDVLQWAGVDEDTAIAIGKKLMKPGALEILTDEEIDITNRVTGGYFISEFVRAWGDVHNKVPIAAVGAMENVLKAYGGFFEILKELNNPKSELSGYMYGAEVLKNVLGPIYPPARQASRDIEMFSPELINQDYANDPDLPRGVWVTGSGRRLGDVPISTAQRVLAAIGIQPMPAQEAYKLEQQAYDWSKEIQNWKNKITAEIRGARPGSVKEQEIYDEAFAIAHRLKPALIAHGLGKEFEDRDFVNEINNATIKGIAQRRGQN